MISPPMFPDMTATRAARPKRRLVPWILPACAALAFLLFCSGLHFPIWNPRARLQSRLSSDLNLTLPPSAKVLNAISVAYRDPGEYYTIEVPLADIPPFIARLQSSAKSAADRDPTEPWTPGRAPTWWTPQTLPQLHRLDLFRPDEQGGFIWYYSPTSTTLYAFWFRN